MNAAPAGSQKEYYADLVTPHRLIVHTVPCTCLLPFPKSLLGAHKPSKPNINNPTMLPSLLLP